jgi:hypothetical protein
MAENGRKNGRKRSGMKRPNLYVIYTAHFARKMVQNGTYFAKKKRNKNGAFKTKSSQGPSYEATWLTTWLIGSKQK